MNFEPRTILVPRRGDNARAGVVSVRVMNNRSPSPAQITELMHRFEWHKLNVRNSLAGFLTRDGELRDGSRFRFVSNSGLDIVMVWPVDGTRPSIFLGEWFRAIPASNSLRSGEGEKPSWGWQLPKKMEDFTSWPDKHKEISARTLHPGHVTWSNPNLKVEGKPIVVTWRGPRDRYAATTGHATSTGGGTVAHELNPTTFPSSPTALDLANDVLKDGPYVWINGHRIDTGVPKVIAACLHQYDPDGAPGQFVLRVCADRTIESLNRQLVVYDLVPAEDADGGTLQDFAEATSPMFVKASYVATDNTNEANPGDGSPGAGKWDYWQRPHFNRSGTRLATLICKVGANGTDRESHAVSFDPTTWATDDDHQSYVTGTVNYTPPTFQVPWEATAENERSFFIACDFEGDTFVYTELIVHQDLVEAGINDGVDNTTGNMRSGRYEYDNVQSFTVNHSVMGPLKQWTCSGEFYLSYRVTPAGGGLWNFDGQLSFTVTNGGLLGDNVNKSRSFTFGRFVFLGDLSKRTFAIGYPEPGSSYEASGTLSAVQDFSSWPSIPASGSLIRKFMLFDVYFDGQKVEEASSGGFARTADVVSSGSFNEFLAPADMFPMVATGWITTTNDTGGQIARYQVPAIPAKLGPPSFEGRSNGTNRAAQYIWAHPAQHQHCAVQPEKAAAYFGAAYYRDGTYGGSVDTPHGLELIVLKHGSDEHPQAYVGGLRPTLSAPVFMGLGADNGETT